MNENNSIPEKPIFDKEYCDLNDIYSSWFPMDKPLAELLYNLVELGKNDKGELVLEDAQYLAWNTYAILEYFLTGSIPEEVNAIIQRKANKLGKMAVKHAIEQIDISRIKVAEKRFNGSLGGRPKKE